ncbi:hypothetical protein PILCRDRAFT_9552 [Piloderma croceum F 1598]|uniref:Uncharacterized protein n=1 Tax=Piloderma croceum (strain F 1598) TaxID=765440 RepID=A0A0C3FLH2_PILCF|nr:hypothetical protein PILCRDRAFT_9552 [Piloderma croceum F 1598]
MTKKQTTTVKSTAKAKAHKTMEKESPVAGKKAQNVIIVWSAKTNHHLMDLLLGIIEDSTTYKVALRFDKGNVGAVSSGGKKVIEQYQSIAWKLFINVKNSTWIDTKDNIRALGYSVKNCVVAYAHHTVLSCLIT